MNPSETRSSSVQVELKCLVVQFCVVCLPLVVAGGHMFFFRVIQSVNQLVSLNSTTFFSYIYYKKINKTIS